MPQPPFSDDAVQRYLAGRDVVVLATLGADGAPLAMPMWFVHDATSLTMVSVAGTAKVRNLEHDPRVCVVAEGGTRDAPDGLVLTGAVTFETGDARAAAGRRFADRYRPAIERIWGGPEVPDDRRVFALRPRVVRASGI